MAITNFPYVSYSLLYPLSIIEPTIVGPREKIFQNKGSQMAGKCYLRMVFANTVFQESHFHSLICRIHRTRVRHSFVSRVYYRAHHGWARRKIFKINVLRRRESAI